MGDPDTRDTDDDGGGGGGDYDEKMTYLFMFKK
jgi:hypothetical protein